MMGAPRIIPPREPFVDGNGFITRPWYIFLLNFLKHAASDQFTADDIAALILTAPSEPIAIQGDDRAAVLAALPRDAIPDPRIDDALMLAHLAQATAIDAATTAGSMSFVSGPASSVDGDFAVFDGTTGKRIKDGGTPAAIATSGSASDLIAGTVPDARMPALTGDVTTSAGSVATTLANSGVTAATYGDASHVAQVAFDAKGRATGASNIAIAIAAGAVSGLAAIATSGSASDLSSGAVPAARMPALTGDITTVAGAVATTLATVNASPGTFGSATKSLTATVNGKGLITALAEQTVTPAVGSITGLGTGVATWLATPSSANLLSALTDANGTGKAIFAAGTLAITSGKTATFNNSITFAGTDATTMTFPSANASIARTDAGQTFVGSNTFSSAVTFSALTAGRIPFSGTAGVQSDSANLAWDNANSRLAIGPVSPAESLHVYRTDNAQNAIRLETTSNGSAAIVALRLYTNSAITGKLAATAPGFTPAQGFDAADSVYLQSTGAGGIEVIASNVTTSPIKFFCGGVLSSNEVGRFEASKGLLIAGQTAVPAGGTQDLGLRFSSTAHYGIFFGSGAPTLSAAKGSLYLRSDGSGTGDRIYVNTNGSTTWTAITTAA